MIRFLYRHAESLVAAVVLVAVLTIFLTCSGCANVQADEAAIHEALVRLSPGVAFLSAHRDEVHAGLQLAISSAQSNPAIQHRLQEALDAYDAGDLASAQALINLGIVATAPAGASK